MYSSRIAMFLFLQRLLVDFDGNQVVRCLESKGFHTGRHHAFAVGMTSNHPAAI